MPPLQSNIEISAELNNKIENNSSIVIKIADQGPGIATENLKNIFDKFHRGNAIERSDHGFGLGLAICKNIIRAHAGSIWVENRKPNGAEFCFTLPIG